MLDVHCSIWNPNLLLLISVAKIVLMGSDVGFGLNVTPCFPLHLPSTTISLLSHPQVHRNHPFSSQSVLPQQQPHKWHSSPCHALSSPDESPLPPPNGTAMAAFGIAQHDPFQLPPVLTSVTCSSARMGKWRRAEHSSCSRQNPVCRHGCKALPASGSSPIPPTFRLSHLRHSSGWSWW